MERNREARRGGVMTFNGSMSRRRQRSGGLRESPEEDGTMEMLETTTSRLRDRGGKRDRDRDRERERSSRGKRRRSESLALHGSGGRGDDMDESSEESLGEDEEEDDDDDLSLPSRPSNPASSSVSPSPNHYHNHHHANHSNSNQNHGHHQLQQRKNISRTPVRWKADEMIGVAVPRKARSVSTKRTSSEWLESAHVGRQASASPSGQSPASASQISPSSSNASIRKKMKPVSGPKPHRPPLTKVSKQPTFIQEEIEVAEVLFGLTRQFKQENHKTEPKEITESKSRASSPQPSVRQPSDSNPHPLPIIAPKRKRPRLVKCEDEIRASTPSIAQVGKADSELKTKLETSSPKHEKSKESSVVRNGYQSPVAAAAAVDSRQETEVKESAPANHDLKQLTVESDRRDRPGSRPEPFLPAKETPLIGSDGNRRDEAVAKTDLLSNGTREQKFSIDLMAPPPGKLSPERDIFFTPTDASDEKSQVLATVMVSKGNTEKREDEKAMEATAQIDLEDRRSEKPVIKEEFAPKKVKGKEERVALNLQLDLEKTESEALVGAADKVQQSGSQQPKVSKAESSRQDKAVPPATLPMPMAVGGWPGNMPPFGFMGQVPPLHAGLVPMNGNPAASNTLQSRALLPPIPRPKRCGTHCYIARLISQQQQLSKINPFWAPPAGAAASTPPMYGARPFNLGVVPPSDAALLGTQMQGSFSSRNHGSSQHTKGMQPAVTALFAANHSEEKEAPVNTILTESAQRKQQQQQQLVLQQPPQSGAMSNMLPGPAFIFPLNQQQAVAMAAAAAVNRGNGVPPAAPNSAVTSSTSGGPATAMNFSFAGIPPTDPQILTILQNGAYPFPPSYRGAAAAQAMPFFNGQFYAPQMPHPSQVQPPPLHQQPGLQQPPAHAPQVHQKTGAANAASPSQKHQQKQIQEMAGFGDGRPNPQPNQSRQLEGDKGSDNRFSQAQKNMYFHPQNYAFMSSAAAAAAMALSTSSGGAGHSEKQSSDQQQPTPPNRNQSARLDMSSSQPFPMPFSPFGGPVSAPVGFDFATIPPNHPLFKNHVEVKSGVPHQKSHNPADGKSGAGESTGTSVTGEEERRASSAAGKFPTNETSHSLIFTKKESEHMVQSIPGSSTNDGSSRTLNLIPGYREGHGSANKSTSTAPPLSAASAGMVPVGGLTTQQQQQQQQQQMLLNLQMRQQQFFQQQQQQQQLAASRPKSAASSNNNVGSGSYPDRLSNMSTFPPAIMTFPQALMQQGAGSSPAGQSPQLKASATARAAAATPSSSTTSVAKNNSNNHHLQQQSRSLPFPSHQSQISFGSNPLKVNPAGANNQPAGPADLTRSLAAAMAAASPSSSVSRSTGGSPPAPSSKPGPSPSVIALPPAQQQSKNSPSSSGNKPSSASHHNSSSILGQPSIAPAPNTTNKPPPHQQQPHQLKQQPYTQHPMFYNPYQPAAAAAANAAYHKRQFEKPQQQQQQQQQQNAAAGPAMVRMPAPGLLHAAHASVAAQSVGGVPHPRMPASFPYMSVTPIPVSSKPAADQKPSAGN